MTDSQLDSSGFGNLGFRNTGIVRAFQVIVGGTGGQVTGVFVYSGNPGPGNSPIAAMTNSSTDPFGNTVNPILSVGPATGIQILMKLISNQGILQWLTHSAIENAVSQMSVSLNGAVGHRFLQLGIFGPSINVVGSRDIIHVPINTGNEDGTSMANIEFNYIDDTGGIHEYAFEDGRGFVIQVGEVTAEDPTNGAPSATNPAIAETWKTVTVNQNGWSGNCFIKKLPFNAVALQYDLVPGTTTVNTPVNVAVNAAYRPAGSGFQFVAGMQNGGGGSCALRVGTGGQFFAYGASATALNFRGNGLYYLDSQL